MKEELAAEWERMRGRRLEEETVGREEGSMEVRLASAAEQSRKVSREEEDAIRSGEGTSWREKMKRKRRDSGRRKFEERCEASNCHRQQMRPASSESTSQAFSFGGRTDINRSGDENVILTSENVIL